MILTKIRHRLDEVVEELADTEHQRWSDWQRYMHEQCEVLPDGSLRIPAQVAKRWQRQFETDYNELSEEEKGSDREQVLRYLRVIERALRPHSRLVRSLSPRLTDTDSYSNSLKTILQKNQRHVELNKEWEGRRGWLPVLISLLKVTAYMWALVGFFPSAVWLIDIGSLLFGYDGSSLNSNVYLFLLWLVAVTFLFFAPSGGYAPFPTLTDRELDCLKRNYSNAICNNQRSLAALARVDSFTLVLRSYDNEVLDENQFRYAKSIDRDHLITQEHSYLFRTVLESLRRIGAYVVKPSVPECSSFSFDSGIDLLLTNDDWQNTVATLMDAASLIVFVVTSQPSKSLVWEMKRASAGRTPTITVTELETRPEFPEAVIKVTRTRIKPHIDDFAGEMGGEFKSSVTREELAIFEATAASALYGPSIDGRK